MRAKNIYQQGSALVLALFVVVVMSLLSTTLIRMLDSSQESVVVEVFGTRALLAANTGIERMAAAIFPLDDTVTSSDQLPVIRCADVFPPLQGSLPSQPNLGMAGCSYTVMCEDNEFDVAGQSVVYYRFTSVGSCSVGDWQTSRQIKVEAKAL